MTGPRLLILADDSDARIYSDVERQAIEFGFRVTRTSTLRKAFLALGINVASGPGDATYSMDCDMGGGEAPSVPEAIADSREEGRLVFFDVVVSKLGRKRGQDEDVFGSVSGIDLLHAVRLHFGRRVFFMFHSSAACRDPRARWNLFQDSVIKSSGEGSELILGGCNMISTDAVAIGTALRQIVSVTVRRFASDSLFRCPWCGIDGLDEDSFCVHCPLYHTNEELKTYRTKHPPLHVHLNPEVFDKVRFPSDVLQEPPPRQCPVCLQQAGHHLMNHIHNKHGPRGRGELPSETRDPQHINSFSLVVCVHDGHILLVQERSNAGYWLPGGHVDGGEGLETAALRETSEEAGVDVELTGVLKIQYKPCQSGSGKHSVRLRVIFLAKPSKIDGFPRCKTLPDYESCGASWVRFDEVLHGCIPLRSAEPYTWVKYLRNKGTVHSLDVLSDREY
mmetsp:Transcript_52086/g.156298  ORF Transcript_52086/g.156298 Transcript_52086/m.156298 type:complete len:449 (-) Transcript_52086:107-1453(-)